MQPLVNAWHECESVLILNGALFLDERPPDFGRSLSDEQIEFTGESLCSIFIVILAVMVLSTALSVLYDPERSIALSLALGLPALVFAILF
ncbi:MAG: hypothetical protein ACXADO_10480, partial [Candidatus Thorarchaeota archaeon]